MAITTAQIKELRERTGAGMMDCKKALQEADADMEGAIEWLRKKGIAKAAKKAGRVAAEGLVAVATSGNKGAVVEVNSETDFVARNEVFQNLVKAIAEVTLGQDSYDAALKADFPGTGRNVEEEVQHNVATIGENMNFRRADFLSVNNGVVASYIHNAVQPGIGKIGILVGLESDGDAAKVEAFGKQVAMHIAATRPESLDQASLDPALVAKERDILIEQAMASGKPKEIAEKMVEGRLRKFYSEVCLLEQVFVIDGKATVTEALQAAEKEIGASIKITGFKRFQLGEGVEKEEEGDFADEVAKIAAGA